MTTDLLPYAQIMAAIYADDSAPQFVNELKTFHGFVREAPDGLPTISVEGTTDIVEWMVDIFCVEVPVATYRDLGPVHAGMMADVLSVIDQIEAWIRGDGRPFRINGHSKGAGEGLLLAGALKNRGLVASQVIAFEAPRIATTDLRAYLAGIDIVQTATHNVHGTDIITQVPFGPTYVDMRAPGLLTVPDSFDIPTKHRIAGVLAGLGAP